MELESSTFSTPAELKKLTAYIHDEYFNVSEVVHDPVHQSVLIPFRRIFHDGEERKTKSGLFSNTYAKDVLWCEIYIAGVVEFKIKNEARSNTCSFNEVSFAAKNNLIRFTCCESCELSVAVKYVDVSYREIEYRGTARIRRGPLFFEYSGPRVYD